VDELTRQKDAVTTQLGQMLSGLAGIVPTVAPAAAKPEGKKAGKSADDGSDEPVGAAASG
jgi:hypothetical protein